jgi:SAM-dependent methyltransferase
MIRNTESDEKSDSFARRLVKHLWRRAMGRNLRANKKRINLLYSMPDPWNLASTREQFRFDETLTFLNERVGHVGSLLEIGCGEGHQSQYLSRLCDQHYGIDISPKAVERARVRLPDSKLAVADIQNIPWQVDGGFDLVVACEVLYYMDDIPAAIARMNSLGSACLVTFFSPAARVVAPHLDHLDGVERDWFFYPPYVWLCAFWEGQPAKGITFGKCAAHREESMTDRPETSGSGAGPGSPPSVGAATP